MAWLADAASGTADVLKNYKTDKRRIYSCIPAKILAEVHEFFVVTVIVSCKALEIPL